MRHREKSRERKTRTEQRRSLLKEARLEGVEAKRVEASLPIYNASPWTQQWSPFSNAFAILGGTIVPPSNPSIRRWTTALTSFITAPGLLPAWVAFSSAINRRDVLAGAVHPVLTQLSRAPRYLGSSTILDRRFCPINDQKCACKPSVFEPLYRK